jgi:flagellar capping protein FliD
MGNFARYKIQGIIDILKSEDINNDKKEYVRKVIDLIEEPIIKRKLKELYNNKYGNIEEQIKELDSNIYKLVKQKQKLEREMDKKFK